jgi:hypothetical protein
VSERGFKKLADDVEGGSYEPIDIAVEEASGVVRTVKTFVVRPHRRRERLWTNAKYVEMSNGRSYVPGRSGRPIGCRGIGGEYVGRLPMARSRLRACDI